MATRDGESVLEMTNAELKAETFSTLAFCDQLIDVLYFTRDEGGVEQRLCETLGDNIAHAKTAVHQAFLRLGVA